MADIANSTATEESSPLRDQAVSRSLDGARARAEQRVQRFLDAATELILEHGGLDFTVQEVVERSTQSLRSFYQFFDGKQHLLLAVYEEAIRAAAAELAEIADRIDDPLERMHELVVTIYLWTEGGPTGGTPSPHLTVRSMATFVFELMTTDRPAVVAATAPLQDQLVAVLEAAVAAERLEVDNPRQAAGFLLQTTMFNAFGAEPDGDQTATRARAETLWDYCLNGITGPRS